MACVSIVKPDACHLVALVQRHDRTVAESSVPSTLGCQGRFMPSADGAARPLRSPSVTRDRRPAASED